MDSLDTKRSDERMKEDEKPKIEPSPTGPAPTTGDTHLKPKLKRKIDFDSTTQPHTKGNARIKRKIQREDIASASTSRNYTSNISYTPPTEESTSNVLKFLPSEDSSSTTPFALLPKAPIKEKSYRKYVDAEDSLPKHTINAGKLQPYLEYTKEYTRTYGTLNFYNQQNEKSSYKYPETETIKRKTLSNNKEDNKRLKEEFEPSLPFTIDEPQLFTPLMLLPVLPCPRSETPTINEFKPVYQTLGSINTTSQPILSSALVTPDVPSPPVPNFPPTRTVPIKIESLPDLKINCSLIQTSASQQLSQPTTVTLENVSQFLQKIQNPTQQSIQPTTSSEKTEIKPVFKIPEVPRRLSSCRLSKIPLPVSKEVGETSNRLRWPCNKPQSLIHALLRRRILLQTLAKNRLKKRNMSYQALLPPYPPLPGQPPLPLYPHPDDVQNSSFPTRSYSHLFRSAPFQSPIQLPQQFSGGVVTISNPYEHGEINAHATHAIEQFPQQYGIPPPPMTFSTSSVSSSASTSSTVKK